MKQPLARKALKPESKPKVGIWWLVGHTLVPFSEPFEQVAVIRGVRDSDLAHVDLWPQVVRRFSKLRGQGYESIPRGRVLQLGSVFQILLPRSLASNKEIIKKVCNRFGLDLRETKIVVDEHYGPPGEIDWEE